MISQNLGCVMDLRSRIVLLTATTCFGGGRSQEGAANLKQEVPQPELWDFRILKDASETIVHQNDEHIIARIARGCAT
jgi:hypothetical protein